MGASPEIAEHEEGEVDEGCDYPEKVEEEAGEEVDQLECCGLGILDFLFDVEVARRRVRVRDMASRGPLLGSEDALSELLVAGHSQHVLLGDEKGEEEDGDEHPEQADVPDQSHRKCLSVIVVLPNCLLVGKVEDHCYKYSKYSTSILDHTSCTSFSPPRRAFTNS